VSAMDTGDELARIDKNWLRQQEGPGPVSEAVSEPGRPGGLRDELRVAVAELGRREASARAEREAAAGRVMVADPPPVPAAAAGLAARLETAGDGELDEIGAAAAAAGRAAREVAGWASRTLEDWQLLRARLETYRIRASRRGSAGRADLAAQHQEARRLLDAVPCDLDQAAAAVHRYMAMERGDAPGAGPA
jgi:hypothetical protein